MIKQKIAIYFILNLLAIAALSAITSLIFYSPLGLELLNVIPLALIPATIFSFFCSKLFQRNKLTIFIFSFILSYIAYCIAGFFAFGVFSIPSRVIHGRAEGKKRMEAYLYPSFTNTVTRGTLINNGDDNTYKCEGCRFEVSFPKTWRYFEKDVTQTYSVFELMTDDFNAYDKGQIFEISESSGGSSSNPTGQTYRNYLQKNFNDIVFDITEIGNISRKGVLEEVYVHFTVDGKTYTVACSDCDDARDENVRDNYNKLLSSIKKVE